MTRSIGMILENGTTVCSAKMETPFPAWLPKTRKKSPWPGFVFWDGEETTDAGYCLFGCSLFGNEPTPDTYIQSPMLDTRSMLDLILRIGERYPNASHVAFSFDYDVNWILRELPWPALITLKVKGEVEWDGYRIKHIPHKIFTVERDKIRVHIDDIFSYFRCRYDKALAKFNIGTLEVRSKITKGKDERADFAYADIDYIRSYWALELQTGCQLMSLVRTMTYAAGFPGITQWYGPGALAAHSLKANDVKSYMEPSPPKVHLAALSAYAGGWFERFKCGIYNGNVETADINSAYVHAMSLLPNLARGHWEYRRTGLEQLARECRFGLFHVKWSVDFDGYMRACHGIPFPLFHRDNNGTVKRPFASDVWLWNPEAANCTTTPFAKLTEAWVFIPDDEDEFPFDWVAAMFDTRLAMQAQGDPSEKILKWALASYYGRLAQRSGWNEKSKLPPMFHQIEFAGWITSKCRAMIYREALDVGRRGGLVSIDTDGIISTVPFRNLVNGEGNQLGRWKVERYDGLIYIQNGFYWLHCNGCEAHEGAKWHDPKLRGIPRAKLDPSVAIDALRGNGHITLARHTFRGYGAALHGKRDEWRKWVDDDIVFSVQAAGSRVHVKQFCSACIKGLGLDAGLHDLVLSINKDRKSKPHSLPWLDNVDTDAILARELAREQRVTHVTLEDAM